MAPRAKNEIQIRFENLADPYNQETSGQYFYLMDILKALGNEANGNSTYKFTFGITEMSVTGELTYGDMVQRKIHW